MAENNESLCRERQIKVCADTPDMDACQQRRQRRATIRAFLAGFVTALALVGLLVAGASKWIVTVLSDH